MMNGIAQRVVKRGFTLIEMLIVISIIMVLIVILVAAIRTVGQDEAAARQVIKSLENALASYYAMYGAYPPSKVPDGYPNAEGISSGAEALYYFLHGPRGEGWGPHALDGGIRERGKNWTPQKAVSDKWISRDTTAPRYYIDALGDDGKPILYYRAAIRPRNNTVQEVYQKNDNAKFWSPSDSEWRQYMSSSDVPNTAVNLQSYVLIAPGNDRRYGFDAGMPTSDDVTNFGSK
jgi:type II secretory pathway pseudopilin PulG